MRYVTLSWDDGARRSALQTAEIFEAYGLRTEFNVVASAALGDASGAAGDFGLWNELQARGHVIQPHGFNHTNKAAVPLSEAQELINHCLDIFGDRLAGFDARQAIFNFPYNASTPPLEAWLSTVVRAFRTGGPAVNPLPDASTVKLTTTGAEQAEEALDHCLDELLTVSEGWLVYTAHGLDGEGWGPMRSEYLRARLDQLTQRGEVVLLPARQVLAKVYQPPGRGNT